MSYYQSFFYKERSNTLTESEILKIIVFLQSTLQISNRVDLKNDELVDYMYELTSKCIKTYYNEIREGNKETSIFKADELYKTTKNIFYSWNILSNDVANKQMDKSLILYGLTGIPNEVRDFFKFSNVFSGERKNITILSNKRAYQAYLEADKAIRPRTRLFLNAEFRKVIQNSYPKIYELYKLGANVKDEELPKLQLIRIQDEPLVLEVKFCNEYQYERIESDSDLEEKEYYTVHKEGKALEYYMKKYERNPKNRIKAIEIHGLNCFGCGFNFEEKYGHWGKDFIEIHHINPLNTLEEEVEINPVTDLVPLCSNCHRMVHRKKDEVLSIERLRELIGIN
ncbi:hypothetical protein FG382_09595 [Psychrobacillus lasiicapitis]|uniref:HNH domain-containing protein n=2 Tax=Psychrobacillus lasiicapitis TaxID=1636719 RepID=A0A544T9B1_9BACI|nr:hypothetical protein FG382_09595 [Psychrobacillus lasiicapitis]